MAVTLDKATKHNVMLCQLPVGTFEYTAKDAILYALGIGITVEDKHGLRYLYEKAEDFQVFPAFGGIITLKHSIDMLKIPGLKIPLEKVLHLQQYIELHRALPSSTNASLEMEVVDVLDMRLGSQYIIRTNGRDQNGPLVTTEASVYIPGDGNFGGKPTTDKFVQKIKLKPSRDPDAILEYKIPANQAAVFRLSGDDNPLHIDPAFAKKANFDRPMLHGNCTMGITAQLVLSKYAAGDSRRFKSMMVRFAGVVYPGDTLLVHTWKQNNCIQFEVKTKEAEKPVITGAYMNILEKPMEN